MRYMIFGVDASGTAQEAYFLEYLDDDEAKLRAQRLLEAHPAIEVWNGSVRIARLMRREPDIAKVAARDDSARADATSHS
jgi:hypothetical protein